MLKVFLVRQCKRRLRASGQRLIFGLVAAAVSVESWAVAPDRKVQQAIVKGVAYLETTQGSDGTWSSCGHTLGETALAGMAIAAGGQAVDSRSVTAAAEAVRRLSSNDTSTYDTALAIMFLDWVGSPADANLVQSLGWRLNKGQCTNGAWTYGLGSGCGPGGDNSNTQFAALAAWVSRRHGIDNDAVLQRLDQYFRGSFDETAGGWEYGGRGGATPTMTCAGLVGIAVHRGAEQQQLGGSAHGRRGKTAADDPIAKRALAALGQELRLADNNPGTDLNSDLYFFWSLERVAVIYDLREIGGVDWYRWGAKRLIQGQSSNGEWQGKSCTKGWPFKAAVGTSFGILFLSRANVAEDLAAQVGSGGGVGGPPPGPGGGSMTFRRGSADDAPPPLPDSSPQQQPMKFPTAKPKPGPGVLDP